MSRACARRVGCTTTPSPPLIRVTPPRVGQRLQVCLSTKESRPPGRHTLPLTVSVSISVSGESFSFHLLLDRDTTLWRPTPPGIRPPYCPMPAENSPIRFPTSGSMSSLLSLFMNEVGGVLELGWLWVGGADADSDSFKKLPHTANVGHIC